MELPGETVARVLTELGYTHVVWIPDSAIGPWERHLDESGRLELVRVCREGEAWAIAGGLYLGGRQPIVILQNTGLFESGDALRNVLFDLKLPLTAIVGYRSYLVPNSPDTAKTFTEPVLKTWGLDYVLIESPAEIGKLGEHLQKCLAARQPGIVLIAEGKG